MVFWHPFHLNSTVQAGVQIPQAVRAAVQQKSSDHRRYFFIPSNVFTKDVWSVIKKVPVPKVTDEWAGSWAVNLRQCCGSGMLIPDPGSELSIPDTNFFPSRIRIKELKYFNPKKLFLSSRKYDPGYQSRIRIFYPSRIQGSKRLRICNTGPGISWIRIRSKMSLIRNTVFHKYWNRPFWDFFV